MIKIKIKCSVVEAATYNHHKTPAHSIIETCTRANNLHCDIKILSIKTISILCAMQYDLTIG